MTDESFDHKNIIATAEGKRLISTYLAAKVTELDFKQNLVLDVDSELHLKNCSCSEETRHSCKCSKYSTPFRAVFILDTEANKFYDRSHQLYDAALLTRCYTQHALPQFIDSEINHKRHFIKIPFINKGIEFINLPSIFKDRSVTSSIPAYSKILNHQ